MIRLLPLFLCAILGAGAAEPAVRHFTGPKGEDIPCTVYAPAVPAAGKGGLIVHLYGSSGSYQHYNLAVSAYDQLRQLLAERGYWIVVPELGRHPWMNAAASAKVDAVIREMIGAERIDRRRVHLIGMSMGASSSLIYVMRHPGEIASLVALFPATDFPNWLEENPKYRRPVEEAHGITPATRAAALAALSPVHHPEAFRQTPVYLLHGGADTTVPPHQSSDFAAALIQAGCSVTYHEVPNAKHEDSLAQAYQREIADFLTNP